MLTCGYGRVQVSQGYRGEILLTAFAFYRSAHNIAITINLGPLFNVVTECDDVVTSDEDCPFENVLPMVQEWAAAHGLMEAQTWTP
jgi:hypothetical protein